MKRMHIHVAVKDLGKNIDFYSAIFGESPSKVRDDYAKWELDQPSVNFAISNRGFSEGINHLGIQVSSSEELEEIAQRLNDAEIQYADQQGASCCYAKSNKHWSLDPSGIAWESFHTLDEIPVFGEENTIYPEDKSEACCIPMTMGENDAKDAPCCIPGEASGDSSGNCC